MDNAKKLFGYDSLAFFGKVSASISHELKNVMAIISETAGLLGDLSEMAREGTALDPDMFVSSTDSIIEEIQRGFTTIRQMNRFAHSVDTPVVSVDLMEILDLTINLSGYLSFSGKVDLSPCEGFTPMAQTSPFLLQAIVYETLVYTFKHTGPGAEISISIQPTNASSWRIIFSGFTFSEFHVFPDMITKAMAASIGVIIHADRSADHLDMEVPSRIDSSMVHSISPEIPNVGKVSRTRT